MEVWIMYSSPLLICDEVLEVVEWTIKQQYKLDLFKFLTVQGAVENSE